ncbi:LutB/LldF family L-lactate oxidation iron-sulfur protein [Calycomorphotria hydatis]|uniref:Lactate utilization protein B n=1 Tax=Calycomorphotria hydatis TaxID=2528027 RepID=A0A517T423_9PLAN|nr:LutB/LldF family L-lactate oxidation iron-sulfur protein [Calycomorphotria hydatis]QDT63122.1 Lactate utilization protein B [Calycomorphotria hydatis]
MAAHAINAAQFIKNPERTRWHDQALWFVRQKRDKQAQSLPEWEKLREHASQIKRHTVSRWADYLEQFERNATRLGAQVHWAKDAAEHNQIVLDIIQKHNAKKIVKSKSMLTEECHLNPFLERHGCEVVDTDLGERIVQLRKEHPSHIVLPAIHIKKEEVSELFHEHLGTEAGNNDPTYLTRAARAHLREKFLAADVGITGVNFAVADTGGIVVCTNEGNADLGASLPKVHIACMGMEKLIPRAEDLAVFTRLLARSATGQPITTYTSHFHGPMPGGELHIILVDNGRSNISADPLFREALKCIRCGACMNTCPVYRRSGGHSYHATVPGPIGSVLNPLQDAKKFADLPHACSLCGSCTDVCPVQIPLHHQLLAYRKEIRAKGYLPFSKRMGMWGMGKLLNSPFLYKMAGKFSRTFVPLMPRWMLYNPLNGWGKQRELPEFPKESFRDRWRKRGGK